MRCYPASKTRRLIPGTTGLNYLLDPAGPKRSQPTDPSGDVADATGAQPTSTRPAGCTWAPTPAGWGLNFTGANATGVPTVRDFNPVLPFSILFTVYYSTSNTGERVMVSCGTGYNGTGFYVGNYGNSLYTTAHTSGFAAGSFATGVPHDVAITSDGSIVTNWLDGKSTSVVLTITAASPLVIGGAPGNPASSFIGWMANVAVHARKLPGTEIAAYFADPTAPFRDRSHY